MRLLPLCLLLAGCSTTPELTLLAGPRRMNNGERDFAVSILLLQGFGKHGVTGCMHQSEPSNGQPFNDDDELTFDTCGAGLRWGGK